MTRPQSKVLRLLIFVRGRVLGSIASATWIGAIGSLAQCIVACCALFVASQANENTKIFRREDAANAEAQVIPRLIFEIDNDPGSIDLRNIGLGPAIVKAIYFHSKEKIFALDEIEIEARKMAELIDVAGSVIDFTFDPQFYKNLIEKSGTVAKLEISTNLIFPGNIIAKDGSRKIATMNYTDLTDINSVDQQLYQKWKFAMQMRTDSQNMGVCYCSITEKSCFVTNLRRTSAVRQVNVCSAKVFEGTN